MNLEKKKQRAKRYYDRHKDNPIFKAKRINSRKLSAIKNIDKIKIYNDSRKEINKKLALIRLATLKGRFIRWKAQAKIRNKEFSISLEFLKTLPKVCFYTGSVLTCEPNHMNTISLDRIDSSKGYIEGNVVFCCQIINKMKTDLNIEEFKNWCKLIVQHGRN